MTNSPVANVDSSQTVSDQRTWIALVVLILAGAAIKGWIWFNTPILARDGIGFVEIAQRLEHEPWSVVLREAPQHPLYPLHVLASAKLFRVALGRPLTNVDWQHAAHLANVGMGVVLVVPMFLLVRKLVGPWPALAATLLFQTLPVPAQVTADTLSEGTYLFWMAVAMWLLAFGLPQARWKWFVPAGLASGLAYLTRPEAAVLPVAVLAFLSWAWLRTWEGYDWRRVLAAAGGLVAAICLVVAPYCLTIGKLGGKSTFNQMLGGSARIATAGPWLFASRFQPGVDGYDWAEITPLFVAGVVVKEIGKGTHYVGLPLALLGLWAFLGTHRDKPGRFRLSFFLIIVVAVNLAVLLWLGWKAHYVSERHTVLIVMVLSPFMAVGLTWLSDRLRLGHWHSRPETLFFAAIMLAALVPHAKPRHQQRWYHRVAGEWLATQWQDGDHLTDPYGYATYYAGQPYFFRKPKASSRRQFVIVEPGEKDRSRLAIINEVRRRGEPIKVWPESGPPEVMLYQADFRPMAESPTTMPSLAQRKPLPHASPRPTPSP
jgi:hypothetical protein